jgi:transcriptional regulator GlxA family with amidase domain
MMDRRDMMKASAAAGAVAAVGGVAFALPRREQVKVAFMLGDGTNIIDLSGPWEVFQDVMLDGAGGMRNPFELYTVGRTMEPVRMTGGFKAIPHYDVINAPQPNVIVVPAHRTDDRLQEWLKRASAGTDITMSVCTGAFKLAEAGLLKGLSATTHHDYWDAFARQFPDIPLQRGRRFVDSGRIATAGGLTSGFDMALHVVARYFGDEAAERTAVYMEHDSQGWRDGRRAMG